MTPSQIASEAEEVIHAAELKSSLDWSARVEKPVAQKLLKDNVHGTFQYGDRKGFKFCFVINYLGLGIYEITLSSGKTRMSEIKD